MIEVAAGGKVSHGAVYSGMTLLAEPEFLRGIAEEFQRITPEPDLPRRYIFYSDGWFWLFSALAIPYVVFLLWASARLNQSIDLGWWILLPLGLLLFPVASGYWICFDSYRWHLPRNLTINISTYWHLSSYLLLRQEWLMRVKQANHLRELGLRE